MNKFVHVLDNRVLLSPLRNLNDIGERKCIASLLVLGYKLF